MNAGAMSTFVAPESGTVIWNVGGALTLGAGTDFSGVALVEGAVTAATSWVTCGNLYATAAVYIGSLNEAALDCSVSAQQSAGLTVSMDNIALLDGSAINSDAPACPFWSSAEVDYITSNSYLTRNNQWDGGYANYSIYMWNDYEHNELYLENYNGSFMVWVQMENNVTPDHRESSSISKETYDRCLATIKPEASALVCPLWSSAEVDHITSNNHSNYVNLQGGSSSYSIYKPGSELYLENYYGSFYTYIFMSNNVTRYREESFYIPKETYDLCLATIKPAFPEF
jgi:hypothetical protein